MKKDSLDKKADKRLNDFFLERNWKPFRFQKKTWSAYANQESGLLHAPTGTGKTYAVWAPPLLEWIKEQKDKPFPKRAPGLRVLWITPLRALVQDTKRSLENKTRLVVKDKKFSICDALLAETPGEITFGINKNLLSHGISVSDKEVMKAIKIGYEWLKLVIEPGGAVALTAAINNIELVKNKIRKFFEDLNVEPFGKEGEMMDPVIHEAMLTQENKDAENDAVLEVFEKGYTYRDKVIRHAKVIVNKK